MRAVYVEPPSELGTRDGLAYALFLPDGDSRGGVVMVHGAGSQKENQFDMARALRAGLAGGEGGPAPELLARIRLLEDRADVALSTLGGTCTAGRPAAMISAIEPPARASTRSDAASGSASVSKYSKWR